MLDVLDSLKNIQLDQIWSSDQLEAWQFISKSRVS